MLTPPMRPYVQPPFRALNKIGHLGNKFISPMMESDLMVHDDRSLARLGARLCSGS